MRTTETYQSITSDYQSYLPGLCTSPYNVMYLQPTTADRGALRVIPGSHKKPLHEDLLRIGVKGFDEDDSQFLKRSGLSGEDIPCYIFESNPGDVITFNEWTWHAAFGGYQDRRTCTFNFYRNSNNNLYFFMG